MELYVVFQIWQCWDETLFCIQYPSLTRPGISFNFCLQHYTGSILLEVCKHDFKIQPPDHERIELYNFVKEGLDYLSLPTPTIDDPNLHKFFFFCA